MFENIEYEILQSAEKFEFKSISYNSKEIKKGDIFVAMKGANVDGKNYINSAIENGAVAIFVDDKDYKLDMKKGIWYYYIKDLRQNLGKIAANLYNHPEKKIKIIGVTGTNGKTTSTYILESVLENSSRVGTTNYRIKNKYYDAKNTTPESLDIIKLLAESVKEKVDYFIMEVSSHALSMGRVNMLYFDGVIFTNLTQDHLDYHKTMDEYFKAKCKIFEHLKADSFVNVNIDDKYLNTLKNNIKTFGIENGDISGEILRYYNDCMEVKIKILDKIKIFKTKLVGKHNLYNILGVISCLFNMGIDIDYIISKISCMESVDGRFELIENNKNAIIVVDYAHTPDGIENAAKTLKEITKGKATVLFGAGGNRDKTKRPLMAKACIKYADNVIITSDNPRNENPMDIIKDIEKGFIEEKYFNYEIIEKRDEAIKKAVQNLKENDSLLIAGKGHETYQIINDEKLYFSDKEEVKKSLYNE